MPDNSFNRGCFMGGNLREKGSMTRRYGGKIHSFPHFPYHFITMDLLCKPRKSAQVRHRACICGIVC